MQRMYKVRKYYESVWSLEEAINNEADDGWIPVMMSQIAELTQYGKTTKTTIVYKLSMDGLGDKNV